LATPKTNAVRLLDRLGIRYELRDYEVDPEDLDAESVARKVGMPPEQVFKTLVADVDGVLTVGIVPVGGSLDLKALAAAVGGKRARMAEVAAAERATGYVAGGISPLGQRRRLRTVLDSSATGLDALFCSGGRRGLEVELAPADLVRLTDALVAPIAAP